MQYRIVEVLGAGGFGVTYLAKDEKLEKLFAIKEYFPEQFAVRKGGSVRAQASKGDDFQWGMQRFLEEARSLARFQHSNIVGVSQIFEANNTAYIVLEYQNGRSLKEWLKEFNDGPGQENLDKIVAPILNALELVHRNNMLHRDLAPDNIYIREDSSPVILDFGSAREAIAARSRTISAIVKSGYSPAEQYSTRGSGQGPWTDVYAFAATLYMCVTGSAPEEATERLISDQYVSAAEATKGQYRKTFLEAIDWGLRLIPKDRPQSVDEWRFALLQDGGAPPLPAGNNESSEKVTIPPGESQRPGLGMFSQRRPQLILAFLIAALALGFGLHQNKEKITSLFPPKEQVVLPAEPDYGPVAPPNNRTAQGIAYRNHLEAIKSLSTDELCRKTLDGDTWSASPILADHIVEAIRRGMTVATCKRMINPLDDIPLVVRAMAVQELCKTALNGEASDWDQGIAYRNHVDEAKRRGLSVQDCRRIVVVNSPPDTPSPQPPVKPEQPPGSRIILGIDRMLSKESNWTIGFNQSLGGCLASVTFADRTTMWFGYTGPPDTAYFAFSNPDWTSIQIGATYNLILDLGIAGKIPGPFAGVQGVNEKGIFHSGLEKRFVDYINAVDEIGVVLNGRKMTQLSLAHFGDARAKVDNCQTAYRRVPKR